MYTSNIINKILIVVILITTLCSCSNKVHVITEWDGDREIRWYSNKKNNNE